jgi:hypothetical protein
VLRSETLKDSPSPSRTAHHLRELWSAFVNVALLHINYIITYGKYGQRKLKNQHLVCV